VVHRANTSFIHIFTIMRRISLLLSIILLMNVDVNAQDARIPLYPANAIPNYQKTSEVEKRDTTGTLRISLVQQPDIAVYLPTRGIATGQAVVICPGGGYGILAYDKEGTDFAKWLNSKGIAAFVLKYRLPNSKSNVVPYLSPLLDAKRAVRLVRANASKWNIKKDKVGIMGFSAGGHLASTLGTHFDGGNPNAADSIERLSSRPDFMILAYPVITMSKPYMHAGSRNNLIGPNPGEELANLYSNDLQVTKETPPTFIVHATDDKGVPVENSTSFYLALKNNGVAAEMHLYPKGGHGFGLATNMGYLETWTDRLSDWLKTMK
jgi:acetyl esterase/lipase